MFFYQYFQNLINCLKEKIELQTCALDVWNKTLNERVNATVNKLQLNESMQLQKIALK